MLQQFLWPTSGVLESNHCTAQITEAKQDLVSPHGWCVSASSRGWNHISFSSENHHAVRKSTKMKKDRWVKADSTLGFLNSLKIVHKHIPPSSSVWRFAWGQRTHHDLIVLIGFISSESTQRCRGSCSGISVVVFITLPTAPPQCERWYHYSFHIIWNHIYGIINKMLWKTGATPNPNHCESK